MKTMVGEKGHVTIPKALRDSLGSARGTVLDMVEENGALVARRRIARDPLDAMLGILSGADSDETLAALRGPEWSEDLDRMPRGRRGR